jgi:type I restriction enzyme S subunit
MKTNWQTKKLGEVCDIKTGKKDVNEGNPNGEYPFFTCARDHTYSDKYSFDMEALLVAGNGDVGHVSYYNGKFEAYQRTYILYNFKDFILTQFLHLFLDGYLKATVSKQKLGNTMPYIKMGMLTDFKIPVPPLSEQGRIVKILDEAFEKIEKAKENAEKNLRNSKELFEYYLRDTFTNTKKDWEVKKLSEIAEYFNGLTYSPKNVSDEGIIVLRSSNVQNDELDFSDIVRVNCRVKEKVMVRDGDILMCSRNGSKRLVGKTATIKNLKEPMTFGTFMMIIRGEYNSYLAWFFKSTEFRKQIAGGENTMINQITRYMLDDVIVSFPPKKELEKVIEKLNELSEQIKKLEEVYKKKMADLEELKKSVLNKAFTGEL